MFVSYLIKLIDNEAYSLLGLFLFLAAVLENVVFDEHTREVDYSEKSVTGIVGHGWMKRLHLNVPLMPAD